MNQENSNNFIRSDEIVLGRYLRLILLQSKLIFIITLVGLALGITLYFSTSKTYKISSMLQVYSPQQNFDPRQSLRLDFFNAPETNLDNLITLYSSRSNMLNLVNELNLNIKVENLNEEEILNIDTLIFKKDEKYTQKVFYLKVKDESFILLDDEENTILEGANGEFIETDAINIQVSFFNLSSDKLIKINYLNPSTVYNKYKRRIEVKNTGNRSNYWGIQEGLIEVSFITDDINEGKDILDTANKIFIKDSIKVETEKARTSIVFIDTQLNALEEVLNLRKNELKSFKQENRSLNVNLEVESIIDLISDVEQEINKVDLELSQAEINFTTDNPLFINLKIQKEALEAQKNNIENKIKNLPTAQQEYIDLYRNLEVSEEMYSNLINRKLNFSLMEASSIGNIRVVDQAFVERLVGPKLSSTMLLTIFSLFMGIFYALFRGAFFISISNPAELKDAGVNENIVGVTPHIVNTDTPFEDSKFEQSIDNLILNLETLISSTEELEQTNCKKILFTSATAENGKSLISKCISQRLASIGNKVLLIDADLKRGTQHKLFNKKSIELDTFTNLNLDNIEDLKIDNNLYLLTKVKNLKNTFEHLYSNAFLSKINEYGSFFDYIIIDTAPALSVSDTGLLMTSSDINFLVTRHQLSRINEIKQTIQIINQIGRSFDGIIYNGYQPPKGYYGYYDIYGDYSYRYYADRYLYGDYYSEKND